MLIADKRQLRRIGEAAAAAGREAATAALAELTQRVAALEAAAGVPTADSSVSTLAARVARLEKVEAAARAAGAA